MRFNRIFCGSQSSSINRSAIDRLRTRTRGTKRSSFLKFPISALSFPALDIHSVKRNDARTIPSFDERKQMDAGIPEVDVHQIRISSQKNAPDDLEFAAVNQRGRSASDTLSVRGGPGWFSVFRAVPDPGTDKAPHFREIWR